MDVGFGGGGDDVVVVGHEDDVMEENVIFFGSFGESREDDAGDLFPSEAEGSVVGSADEVVGVFGLDDAGFPGHAGQRAESVPIYALTPVTNTRNESALTPVTVTDSR